MKRKLMMSFPLILFYLAMACSPKSVPMSFTQDNEKTIEVILQEASTNKKLIFVDIYTSWCGPCKWMDANVFIDEEVVKKFNKSYINYKVNGESFDGVNLCLKYRVDSYPTYLFLNAKGEVVHRLEGMLPAQNLLNEAHFADNRSKRK